MPKLSEYNQFEGLHWETGSLRNFYAYQGIIAPHTDQPYSESMLLGVSGGLVMGYFTFHYEGNDPMVHILTRNTFDPLDNVYERLNIEQEVRQTGSAQVGVVNLVDLLEGGLPAIVMADRFSLPYNALPYDEGNWGMFPILVYGYDEDEDRVWIADRARVPLTVSTGELAAARARVKKTKFRVTTFGPPDEAKLLSAVRDGIRDCISLFTEPPPKGSKHNFGFLAYERLADVLTKSKSKGSWAHEYPPGNRLFAALTSAYNDIVIFGKDGSAERDVYARFLEEASAILGRVDLNGIADKFRSSAVAWNEFAVALLPEEVPLLKETRELMLEKHHLFLDQGNQSLSKVHEINERLAEIKSLVSDDFPLSEMETIDLRADLRDRVLKILDIERDAISELSRILDGVPG
jgi:hypothetical protein